MSDREYDNSKCLIVRDFGNTRETPSNTVELARLEFFSIKVTEGSR